ncbi:MAG: dihydrodipicolinate synthase family protein [Chloroflexota bacterium]|nr:dihydrodipicolinate synthase family protein [Chloroflexota bacterium]MDE2907927.1 dihydrodipicolinate synthase family protein [Chloroflexota bacterium]
MLEGIAPILFTPFDDRGDIDADGLRSIVRFEIDGGVHAIGINGFASEAYKMTDDERWRTVELVAGELAGALPLIIGIAPNSAESAIQQARQFAAYRPAALMTLPPATMDNGAGALVEFYIDFAKATDVPIILQQAPHIPQYRHTELTAEALAEIADRSPNVLYYKLEGPGSAAKMRELKPLLPADRKMFGGGGGITVLEELRNGAAGLIPGVGFNELFLAAWDQWKRGDEESAEAIILKGAPLTRAVSGPGHEYSLHMRKQLMKRYGAIGSAIVRKPTIAFDECDLPAFFAIVDALDLRVAKNN